MSTPSILSRLGIYTEENFLDSATCETLIAAMRASNQSEAGVYDKGWNRRTDFDRRRTTSVSVDDAIRNSVGQKLAKRIQAFEVQFDVKLSGSQDLSFLIYRPGDFFEPHQDHSSSVTAPENVKQRRLSVVVFLNDPDATKNHFTGGSLAFYGLLEDPRCRHIGIPVSPRAGRLVVFRSNVFHQVTPVVRGERFSVVSWLY